MKDMQIKSIRHISELQDKKVLLRVDFNVPLKAGKVKEDYKITRGLATIRYLLRYKCKIAIATHLGDPGGKRDPKLSVKPAAARLHKLLGVKVVFSPDITGPKVVTAIDKIKADEVLFLENLRFDKGERANDYIFAKKLAQPFDLCVNDAFAESHRECASVSAINNYLPSYAGLLLEDEVEKLSKLLRPKRPFVAVIGGAKVGTKLPLLLSMVKRADHILVGGAIANDFLKGLGYEVGRSVVGKDDLALVKAVKIYKKAGNKKIILPEDFLTSDRPSGGEVRIKGINRIEKNDYIFDIGPRSINLFAKYIKQAETIVWNGPMGLFENENFKHGTVAIARLIAARSTGRAYGVVGGGETVEALQLTKMLHFVDWVSTGGGAMLDFLAGEPMPGLKRIVK